MAGVASNLRGWSHLLEHAKDGIVHFHHDPVVHDLGFVEDLSRAQNWDCRYVRLEKELEPGGSRPGQEDLGHLVEHDGGLFERELRHDVDAVLRRNAIVNPEHCHEPVKGPSTECADTQPFVVLAQECARDEAGSAKRATLPLSTGAAASPYPMPAPCRPARHRREKTRRVSPIHPPPGGKVPPARR